MLSTDALARLADYQAEIADLLDQVAPLLSGTAAERQSDLAHLRWRMVRTLRAYQVFKHHEIFDALAQSGSPAQAARAKALKARCMAVDTAFRAHVTRWSATDVAASWQAYLDAATAMSETLRRHVADERASITLLLAGTHRTRRPAAQA